MIGHLSTGTFGTVLRAARLGYRFSNECDAWVRMSIAKRGGFEIVVVPRRCELPATDIEKMYTAWWEHDDIARLFDLCEPLRALVNGKRLTVATWYLVGEDGRVV